MTNRIDEIRQRCDAAEAIINDLHTERLDYTSEYLPLIESNHDIPCLLGEIDRLNDAHEAMLRDLQMRSAQVEALGRERDSAVEDLYKACKHSPCNTGICVKKNCAGNHIPCEFEWRGPQDGKGDAK